MEYIQYQKEVDKITKPSILKELNLIICTYNREEELNRLLCRLDNLSYIPSLILVVNGGSPLTVFQTTFLNVEYLVSKPGLTLQRNLGIEKLEQGCEFVSFIDDDAFPISPNYFKKIVDFLKEHKEVAGVSPTIQQNKGWNFSMLLSKIPFLRGKILINGINLPNNMQTKNKGNFIECPTKPEFYITSWLPGCAFTLRKASLSRNLFDIERLGYGEGEDVDVSLRIKKKGALAILFNSIVFHEVSKKNRYNQAEKIVSRYQSRLKLGRDFPEKVSSNVLFIELHLVKFLYQILTKFTSIGSLRLLVITQIIQSEFKAQ